MKVESLKDLEAVIKLCRRTGIEHMIVDGIELNLGPEPVKYRAPKPTKTAQDVVNTMVFSPSVAQTPSEHDKIPTDGLTEEQLLFYSVAATGESE